jgi:SET domain-containing protein
MEKHIYKPLPMFLTIRESNIHGLGLFTKENLPKGTLLGVSHVHKAVLDYETLDITFAVAENKVSYVFNGNHKTWYPIHPDTKLGSGPQVYLMLGDEFPNGMIRTPLGGFINHSEEDNLDFVYLNGGLWGVITKDMILKDTELTLNYSLTPCGVIKANTD